MNETRTKIPGTLYSLKFGIEGKYYAVFLYRGNQEIYSKKLEILRGTSLRDLPEELENGLKYMLDKKEIHLSPVIVDRVVNNLLEKIPENGSVFDKESSKKKLEKPSISVQELVKKSEKRLETQKQVPTYTPAQKQKYDASAEDLGKYNLKKPKPLPEKREAEQKSEIKEIPIKEEPKKEHKIKQAENKTLEEKKEMNKKYQELQKKVDDLNNEVSGLVETIKKNEKQIGTLEQKIIQLKKEMEEK